MTTLDVTYLFRLPDGEQARFDLALDGETFELRKRPLADPPAWAQLQFQQCGNCPLNTQSHPLCPVAHSLVDVVPRFEHLVSYDRLTVEVRTADRIVIAQTDVQQALSSLMGLLMASSGCPHTSFFRPMARFHLPLANEQETTYRSVTTYLLAQFLLRGDARDTDERMSGLHTVYENMQVVNAAMARRLRAAGRTDSTLNAVVLLDLFAIIVPAALEDSLAELRLLLEPYLRQVTDAGEGSGSDGTPVTG